MYCSVIQCIAVCEDRQSKAKHVLKCVAACVYVWGTEEYAPAMLAELLEGAGVEVDVKSQTVDVGPMLPPPPCDLKV